MSSSERAQHRLQQALGTAAPPGGGGTRRAWQQAEPALIDRNPLASLQGGDHVIGGCAPPIVVSRPFPSWNRSISTEIYLCHACSCQEILRTETAGQVAGIAVASMPAMATANVATGSVVAASGARAQVAERTGSTPKRTITVCAVQDDVGDL
jgi:hypothetical protein